MKIMFGTFFHYCRHISLKVLATRNVNTFVETVSRTQKCRTELNSKSRENILNWVYVFWPKIILPKAMSEELHFCDSK
jgi:hypothetical protein